MTGAGTLTLALLSLQELILCVEFTALQFMIHIIPNRLGCLVVKSQNRFLNIHLDQTAGPEKQIHSATLFFFFFTVILCAHF